MASADELFGGIWDGVYQSGPIDAYAAAVSILDSLAVNGTTEPTIGSWQLLATNATTTYAANGRAVTSYPEPSSAPVWVIDSLANPTTVLTQGIDFTVSDGLVAFDVDPLTYTNLYTSWVSGSPVNTSNVWYGVPATPSNSTPPDPSTYYALVSAVATGCDSPAATLNETVQALFHAADGWRVITDKSVYRLGVADSPSVVVDQVLVPGLPIGSAWALTKLGPSLPNLTYLTTPAGFNQGVTQGGITWYNGNVATVIDTYQGRTRLRFAIGATSQSDVNAFWTQSQINGTAAGGITLAQALDTRKNPVGDPDRNSLPSFVNPLLLVTQLLLEGNAYLLILNSGSFGPNAQSESIMAAAIQAAAGPYTTVFTYFSSMPELPVWNPE